MKRSKKLYVLMGVFIVICGVTFGVSRYEKKKEEIKNSDEVILEVKVDDVTGVSWEYDETKLAFHKDKTWLYDDDEDFPVNEEKINDLLELFESFRVSFVIEDVEDFGQYGLNDPTCNISIETAEETYEILLGDYSKMDEERYISIGDGNVYLVSTDPMENFGIKLDDMILHDKTPSIEQADDITFTGNVESHIIYQEESDATYNADDVYFVDDEEGYLPLDTDTIEEYFSSIENLSLRNYKTYHATEEELEEYGLDDPELTTTIQYTVPKEDSDKEDAKETKTFVLHLSRSAEEKKKAREKIAEEEDSEESDEFIPAYVKIGDSQIIYEITEEEYESLMKVSYDELRHQGIFWADFSDVYQVDISLEGQTYTMTSKEDDEEATWLYEDETVEISDFREALASLTASEFTKKEIKDKEEISLTLYLNDENYPKVHIGLYRQDGEHCTAVVDGEPIALVSRSKVIELVEAVNAIVLK